MMKKVFMSLLMTVICLPALFAQGNAAHVIKIDSITTCYDYVWERNNATYTEDTVVLYSTDDTTFILNYTRLHSVYDTNEAILVEGNCSASWGGRTWTQSGIYYDTLPSASGCDSIVKLKVSIASQDTLRDEVVCGSFTAPWGKVYTESGIIDTVIVLGSCTYHNIINLTVNPTYTNVDIEIEGGCYYIWGDTTITDLLPHTRTFKTAEGQCDSIVTLTVNSYSGEQFDTVSVVSCDSYKPAWTSAVTTSGFYSTDSTIYINGESCSKHYTIDLTIVNSNNDSTTAPVNITAGCSYNWEGTTITDEDIHYHLYSSVIGGCDSLGVIQVSFTGKEYDTLHVEYCGSSYNWKSDNSNLPGNASKYTFTTDTVAKDSVVNSTTGCTDVYVLDLKFKNNKDTVYQYSCGYEFSYDYQKANGTKGSTVFTESGYYALSTEGDTMYNVNKSTGCKTERTLNLKLNIPELRYRPDTTVAVACEKYTFRLNDEKIQFSEDADTDLVRTQRSKYYEDQCYDSIAHLTLTIKHHTYIERNPSSVCDSYTWIENGDTIGIYTTSGTYRDTLDAPNEDGCLAIARLKLNLYSTPSIDIIGNWMLEPGESTVLTARPSADSDPITRYRWYIGNAATAASTDSTLELSNVTENTDVRLESTSNHNCVAKNWITVTANLGIDQVESLNVNIYPNPASRFLNISSEAMLSQVEVYNTVGQKVISTSVNGTALRLDLNSLASGHYTLRLLDAEGNQTTRKFVINK